MFTMQIDCINLHGKYAEKEIRDNEDCIEYSIAGWFYQ